MRSSLILLVCSLLGVVAGASLIGPWAVGCAVIFDSLCVGVHALAREYGERASVPVPPGQGLSLGEVLERARQAP